MSASDVDKIVFQYLRQKGYTEVASHFEKECMLKGSALYKHEMEDDSEVNLVKFALDVGLAPETFAQSHVIFWGINQGNPDSYCKEYNELETWVMGSLDAYKTELSAVRFPLFLHSYLDLVEKGFVEKARTLLGHWGQSHRESHSLELDQLTMLQSSEHITASAFAQRVLKQKFLVRLCTTSFELLNSFLTTNHFLLMTALLNARVIVKVEDRPPLAEIQIASMEGTSKEILERLHQEKEGGVVSKKQITWGVLPENNPETFPLLSHLTQGPLPKLDDNFNSSLIDRLIFQSMGPECWGKAPYRSDQAVRERASALDPSALCVTFLNSGTELNCMEVTSDGMQIAAGFQDRSVRAWRLDGRALNEADMDERDGNTMIPPPEPSDPEPALVLRGHSQPVYSVSWAPDQRFLLTCGGDGTARLWDIISGKQLVTYRGHTTPVWDACFSPVGYYFATGSYDNTARMWSTDRLHPLRLFVGHLSDVSRVAFHPNCNYIASGSCDKTVRLWDVQSGDCVRVFSGHPSAITALTICPTGRYIAAASDDSDVRVWDISNGKQVAALKGHFEVVHSLAFSVDGSTLASGSQDCSVKIWDMTTLQQNNDAAVLSPRHTFQTKNTPIYSVRFTKRNLLLVGGSFMADQLV